MIWFEGSSFGDFRNTDTWRPLPLRLNCRYHQFYGCLDYLDLNELFFVRKMNGMANGPKRAPIKAQYHVFAPLLSAIYQSKNAHAMHIMEIIIAPNINQISLY